MKRLLIIIGILASFSLFSQIAEKKQYPFPTYCYNNDGITNYIDLGNSSGFDITNKLTIYARIKFTTSQNNKGIVSKWRGSTNKESYLLFVNAVSANKIQFAIEDSGVSKAVSSANTYNDGDWHNVVAIADGNNLIINIDNTDIVTGDAYSSIDSYVTRNVQIGTYADNPLLGFEGQISCIAIWDSDKSFSEAISLDTVNMIDSWALCEGYNDTIYPLYSNNKGVIQGAISSTWQICSGQTYPETNGVSKHYYKGHAVYVPYLLSGQPISTTAINAAETVINYSFTLWGKTYLVK